MKYTPQRPNAAILLCLGLVLTASASLAEWSTSPYVNNPVDLSPQEALFIETVPDGNDGILIIYIQIADGGTTFEILAQRVDRDGNLVWGSPVIVMGNFVPANVPFFFGPFVHSISDGAGGAFVAMNTGDEGNARIRLQHINSNGSLSWDAAGVPVITNPTGFDMLLPAMALDDAGGVYVAWQDYFSEVTTDSDIYAQRMDAAGNRLWSDSGAHVCNAAETQNNIKMVRDGEGGCYVVWADDRATVNSEPYAQRLLPDSSPEWDFNGKDLEMPFGGVNSFDLVEGGPSGGFLIALRSTINSDNQVTVARFRTSGNRHWEMLPVPSPGNNQDVSQMIPDGQGGAFVAVTDGRNSEVIGPQIYFQAIDPSGAIRWSPAGVLAGVSNEDQYGARMIPDGTGGLMATWLDGRTASSSFETDVYGQRISNIGTRMWDESGTPIVISLGPDYVPSVHTDGRGGFLIPFTGERYNDQADVFAQRVGFHGKLGDATPKITAVTDYPLDQGGVVLLDWDPSYLDDLTYLEITEYTIWSRYAGASSKAALDGPELEKKIRQLVKETKLDSKMLRTQLKSGWTMVDQVEAFQRDSYTSFAPTHADSSDAGTPMTEFQVLAHGQWSVYWESNIMGGYSVDNLAPGAPVALMGSYQNPDGVLEWSPNAVADDDLAGYRVYRSDEEGFTPGPASFVATTPDTSFADMELAAGTWYYVVTAEDFTNNESEPSNQVALQTATSAVDGETPQAFQVKGAVPNPFNPSTSIHFSLGQAGPTTVEIFDTRGRLVRRLVNEAMGAGNHEAAWNGRDDQGRGLPSGVYLAQVRSGAQRGVTKMILAK